jgi:pectate lyase
MTQVVGTVYDGSTAATTHTITVPSGVTTAMTALFVIGTGSSTAVTTTLSFAGASFSKLDEQNAVNTRVAVWTGSNLTAGNQITLTLSGSAAVTVGHYYQDTYIFASGSLSAATRSVSSSSTTSGSVTPGSGQQVVIVGVERTTTATTLAGVTTSGGDAVTNTFYGEGTGSAQASVYAGIYTAGSGAARTATITYSNSSGNGYAAQILTSGAGGGGGGGGGGGASTPGAMHNMGKAGGKNHFNLGIGYPSGHVDITENALEAGFVEPGFYELNSDGTAVRMSTPLNGGTTSANTQYPRVEYRELQAGGAGDSSTPKAAWNGNTGVHYMKGRTRVLKMPPNKPQLVIAQVHDADDDTAMIRLSSKTNVEFKLGDTVVTSRAHVMGTWYDWMIRVENGDISWYWGDLSTPVATRVDGHTGSGYYFKFGCYAQSNDGIDSVSDGPFIVEVAPFPETWHTGYAAPSIPSAAPTVNAGDDATVQTGTTFARTATENSSSAITSRTWKILSGPTGVGSTIDTDASLAWTPTVAGFYTLRYSATNSSGTGTDDLGVTVTTDEPGGGGTGGGAATADYQEKFLDGVAWPVITRQSTVVSVSGASAFGSAVSAAAGGQRLTLASTSYTGTYSLTGKSNVTIEASTLGGATFGSGSQLTIKDCTNVLIRGLNFTTDSAIEAINIRGTSRNIWIDQCTIGPSGAAVNSASSGQMIYISDTAEFVRLSYNWLRNKGTAGNQIKVYGNDAAGQVNKHILVDHNILQGVKPAVSNGKEPVRHGVSTMSKSMSYSTYCMNFWIDCLAEPENFSGKAGGLAVYGNTFYRCSGGAVLRHGTDCVMSDNYFIDGVDTTASDGVKSGGIRGYDSGHDIEHNYMDGLAGAGFQASLLIDRGDAEGSSTNLAGHWRVINALVNRNVIINSATPIVVWNGSQYSLNPSNVTITNNLTAGTTQAGPIVFNGGAALVSSPAPSGNVHYASPAAGGFTQDSDGIWRKAGYGPRLTYIKQTDVGPGGALYDTNRAGTALGGSTGGGTGTTTPVVNAGADLQVVLGSPVTRTGTVVTGAAITAHRWSVVSGPAQVGTTLSSTASLVWTPPQLGTFVLRYAATNSAGSGTDDITVTVTTGGGSTAAPTFVGASAGNSGESSAIDIPAPAGIQAGDFEIAVILSAGPETMTATPAGWSLLRQADVVSAAGDPGGPCTAWLYSRTVSGSGVSAAWTKSGTRVWHATRAAWRGLSSLGQVAVTAETSPGTSHLTPTVTPASANSVVVGVVAADLLNATTGPFTPPAGWTERYDRTVTVTTENESIAIADFTPGGGGGSAPPAAPGFFMFSQSEIDAAASSGTAFTQAKTIADTSIGTVNLADQDMDNAAIAYCAALMYVKTGTASYRTRVESALAQLPSASTPPRSGETGGVLPVARQLAGWIIAADLVGYRPAAFTSFASAIRTRNIGGHGLWDVLKTTSQVTANNWGTHSLAARAACSAYLGDTTDLNECANIFRRWTGENRSVWSSWVNTDDHDESWVDSQPMAGINGAAAVSTKAGAVVEDICRGPSHPSVDEVGLSYSWEALQGAMVTAKILTRAGYGDCFGWGGNALLRAAQFINGKAPSFSSPPYGAYPPRHPESQWVPYAINRRYGVSLSPLGSATDRGWGIAAAHWIF